MFLFERVWVEGEGGGRNHCAVESFPVTHLGIPGKNLGEESRRRILTRMKLLGDGIVFGWMSSSEDLSLGFGSCSDGIWTICVWNASNRHCLFELNTFWQAGGRDGKLSSIYLNFSFSTRRGWKTNQTRVWNIFSRLARSKNQWNVPTCENAPPSPRNRIEMKPALKLLWSYQWNAPMSGWFSRLPAICHKCGVKHSQQVSELPAALANVSEIPPAETDLETVSSGNQTETELLRCHQLRRPVFSNELWNNFPPPPPP